MRRWGRPPIDDPTLIQPADYSAGQDFIDRQGGQLLPTIDRQAPSGAAERDVARAPLGEPPTEVDVRSVYDARPIQAFDVLLPLVGTTELRKAAEGTNLSDTVTMQVPYGYVFVMRAVQHFFSGAIPPIVTRDQALLTIVRSNGDIPYNAAIPVGAASIDLVKTFLIYDENEQFGARMVLSATLVNFAGAFFGATFYGNFLRKTGRNAAQEIGNKVLRPPGWGKNRMQEGGQ